MVRVVPPHFPEAEGRSQGLDQILEKVWSEQTAVASDPPSALFGHGSVRSQLATALGGFVSVFEGGKESERGFGERLVQRTTEHRARSAAAVPIRRPALHRRDQTTQSFPQRRPAGTEDIRIVGSFRQRALGVIHVGEMGRSVHGDSEGHAELAVAGELVYHVI